MPGPTHRPRFVPAWRLVRHGLARLLATGRANRAGYEAGRGPRMSSTRHGSPAEADGIEHSVAPARSAAAPSIDQPWPAPVARAARAARSSILHAPSSSEYSEWTWRWAQAGVVTGPSRIGGGADRLARPRAVSSRTLRPWDAAPPPSIPAMAPPALPDSVAALAARLAGLPGAVAVVLGGSRATGEQRPDSDWDLGLYYRRSRQPLDPDDVRSLGYEGHVSELGEWGPIVHGGAWLTVDGAAVDVLFRELDTIEAWLDDARAGRFEIVWQNGCLVGAPTYLPVGELALCRRSPASSLARRSRVRSRSRSGALARACAVALMFADGYARAGDVVCCTGMLANAVLATATRDLRSAANGCSTRSGSWRAPVSTRSRASSSARLTISAAPSRPSVPRSAPTSSGRGDARADGRPGAMATRRLGAGALPALPRPRHDCDVGGRPRRPRGAAARPARPRRRLRHGRRGAGGR